MHPSKAIGQSSSVYPTTQKDLFGSGGTAVSSNYKKLGDIKTFS
jgi:hypothetical protein